MEVKKINFLVLVRRSFSAGGLLFSIVSLAFGVSVFHSEKSFVVGQETNNGVNLIEQNKWVDSIFKALTPDERLGQLFMMSAFSNKDEAEKQRVIALINTYKIGGLIMMQGSPVKQAQLTNYYQSISKVPMLISQDAEWGLSMRLDSTIYFPRQLTLGAIQNDSLIYDFGKEMSRECKRVGVNVSFSPVMDVNNNALNPVIGDRSFGENKFNVAKKGIAYMRGLQDGGVIACAKHFPGHGNTDKDSHKTLPTISGDKNELDSLELYPFKEIIAAGIKSVMVAHLFIPALDSTVNQPSTLSKKIVTDLLRTKLGFDGLVITDGMNMEGLTKFYPAGVADIKALMAGNDMLLISQDIAKAMEQIKLALTNKKITQEEIDAHVKRILAAKYFVGLNHYKAVDLKNLTKDLNNNDAKLLKQKLVENSLTLVRNKNNFIPFAVKLDSLSFASVAIGTDTLKQFQTMLSNYAPVDLYQANKDSSKKFYLLLANQLSKYNVVFVSLHSMNRKPEDFYGIRSNAKLFIDELKKTTKVVVVLFGNPYALEYFHNEDYLLEAYADDEVNQKMAAELLFGGIAAKGKLPVSAGDEFHSGDGLSTKKIRLKYSVPEDVGLKSSSLFGIDKIVNDAITDWAFPGCQVFVAKDGEVIYNKSFGWFTYDYLQTVQNNSLYDLASVTKISATTMAVMKLFEEGKIDLDKPVSFYLPEFAGTNKADIKVHEVLTHQAGLKAFIPFYTATLDSSGKPSKQYYSSICTDEYCIPVTQDLFLNKKYEDEIWKQILQSQLGTRGNYVYSDLDFYIMQKIVEKQSGEKLDDYVEENFYSNLGLSTMTYLPLKKFSANRIVPSNYDNTFRHELIQGTVHDPGAAMVGGVAGHAGLFSNANDLGTLMQMILNDGNYGGVKYLDSTTVDKFTAQYSKSCRRGLGFDKPNCGDPNSSPTIADASCNTYGHQGFTGTVVWVDPQYHLVYVFLSNRTYPDDANQKINSLKVRTAVQQVIYDAVLGKK